MSLEYSFNFVFSCEKPKDEKISARKKLKRF